MAGRETREARAASPGVARTVGTPNPHVPEPLLLTGGGIHSVTSPEVPKSQIPVQRDSPEVPKVRRREAPPKILENLVATDCQERL